MHQVRRQAYNAILSQTLTNPCRNFVTSLRSSLCRNFCGKAKLSKRLRQKGFHVLSVDHVGSKGVPILRIDIGNASQRQVLEELLQLDKIVYVHLAPPCGTASAAREIKPGPPPLRSLQFPMGLPGLTFVQNQRVQKANFLYQWTCKVVLSLHARGIAWSIENPASSLMWITEPFVNLLHSIPDLVAFSFHTCMFAASRKKDTALWTSVHQLRQHLERKCDDNHQHLRWGKTATGLPQLKNVRTMTHYVQHGRKQSTTLHWMRVFRLHLQQLLQTFMRPQHKPVL